METIMARYSWIVVLLVFLRSANLVAREWTSADNTHSVEAELVRIEDGRAILRRKSDRKLFSVGPDSLSIRDRRYLRDRYPSEILAVIPRQYPTYISPYELSTPNDLYYARVVQRVNNYTTAQLSKWPMLLQIKKESAEVLAKVLDANAVSSHIAYTCSVDQTESPLDPVRGVVEDCCRILGLATP